MIRSRSLFIMLLFCASNSMAQTYLHVPVNIETTYNKQTRTMTGVPGKNYWQNTADYNIKVNFDPQTRNLSGSVAIDYVNNSPDTLRQLWFKLYPNFYKRGVMRNYKLDAVDMTDGVKISKMTINNTDQDQNSMMIDGTNMVVGTSPLLPKQKAHININYSYTLNRTSHVRTGQIDSGSYFIAYFFPRVAVYDDIDGWNRYPYLGTEEFYNDLCHFNAEITVPKNYQVWATGNLKNTAEVYADKFVKLIGQAERTEDVTTIVSEQDLKNGGITAQKALTPGNLKPIA